MMMQIACVALSIPEILQAVTSFIDDSSTLARCARVHSLWNEYAIPILWRGCISHSASSGIPTPKLTAVQKYALRKPERLRHCIGYTRYLRLSGTSTTGHYGRAINLRSRMTDDALWSDVSAPYVHLQSAPSHFIGTVVQHIDQAAVVMLVLDEVVLKKFPQALGRLVVSESAQSYTTRRELCKSPGSFSC